MSNEIGELGESIFNVAISRDYKFRPRHLGEKWPASDFYVEHIGPTEIFFFIVQVKGTHSGLNNKGNLKIKVPKKKLQDLNTYYCPTYVAGVDNDTEEVYLVSVNTKRQKGISLNNRFWTNVTSGARHTNHPSQKLFPYPHQAIDGRHPAQCT